MKNIILFTFIAFFCSCRNHKNENKVIVEKTEDNPELKEIYTADQIDRKTIDPDPLIIMRNDSLRRIRVLQLLDSNKVKTSGDYKNAAMIFQHGRDSADYGMAVKLMKKAIALDSTTNKWLLAAATDRYLLSKGKPQIFGTQYYKEGDTPWKLSEIDTTVITDEERIKFSVGTLAQLKEKVKTMNRVNVFELYDSGNSADQIIKLVKKKSPSEAKNSVSENEINGLGHYLMGQGKDAEALKIFKLNTELFPEGFKHYESYGECLLKTGDSENAVIAYRKALELNPDNEKIEEILKSIE
ncbi:tetratricopeptide repeat protein [Sinomicrobium sp. M5D2P9]